MEMEMGRIERCSDDLKDIHEMDGWMDVNDVNVIQNING